MRGHHFLSSHYLWSLNCVVLAQACQTQSVCPAMLSMNHIVQCNALCWDMWSKMKVITESCYFFFKAWNVVPCVSPIVSPSFQSSKHTWQHCYVRACVFGVFRHLIFWIGMFKVFRWFGLEILIPKHMWKRKIGPLQQIWASICYGTFFLGHPVQCTYFLLVSGWRNSFFGRIFCPKIKDTNKVFGRSICWRKVSVYRKSFIQRFPPQIRWGRRCEAWGQENIKKRKYWKIFCPLQKGKSDIT